MRKAEEPQLGQDPTLTSFKCSTEISWWMSQGSTWSLSIIKFNKTLLVGEHHHIFLCGALWQMKKSHDDLWFIIIQTNQNSKRTHSHSKWKKNKSDQPSCSADNLTCCMTGGSEEVKSFCCPVTMATTLWPVNVPVCCARYLAQPSSSKRYLLMIKRTIY